VLAHTFEVTVSLQTRGFACAHQDPLWDGFSNQTAIDSAVPRKILNEFSDSLLILRLESERKHDPQENPSGLVKS
jgi:hypothetical protein